MNPILKHLSKCMVGGIVALLPIVGLVVTVVYFELLLGGWLIDQPWYFPGLGILLALAVVYAIGLAVTTVIGRWIWNRIDAMLARLPLLGQLYQTMKQVLGYGQGEGALFREVVLLPGRDREGNELGLVTYTEQKDGGEKLTVFVPTAPNPGNGRVVIIPAEQVTRTRIPVHVALKALVSVGAVPLTSDNTADQTHPATPPTSATSPTPATPTGATPDTRPEEETGP